MDAPDFAQAEWRKSSYSNGYQNCVEVAFAWHKSSYSDGYNNCVEVALTERATALRDSKNPTGPVLTVGADAWRALVFRYGSIMCRR
ncbi:MAG: DUF397 domain-containing protein [Sciscionella sp.]